jgi:hypothetical protein
MYDDARRPPCEAASTPYEVTVAVHIKDRRVLEKEGRRCERDERDDVSERLTDNLKDRSIPLQFPRILCQLKTHVKCDSGLCPRSGMRNHARRPAK